MNECDIGDAKITSGTIIEMNITGTLPPTGNLKPNLKASPSLFMHAKSAQSVNHDVNTRDVTTRSSYIHFNGYKTLIIFENLTIECRRSQRSKVCNKIGCIMAQCKLGHGQTSNFSCAEPNANEVKKRT